MSPPFPGPLQLSAVVLGRFRITGVLARGGQAMIYAAEDVTGRALAAKVVRMDTADPYGETRLAREGALLARLNHPHIVTFVAAGLDGPSNRQCVITHRVPGIPLSFVVARGERLEPRGVVAVVEQLAGALEAVHALGHVVRDLTPSQVIVDPTPEGPNAVLVDLGLARKPMEESPLTDPAAVAGTPGYLAPEMLDGEGPNAVADVYSLGALAYAMVAGRGPFAGLSPTASLAAQYAGLVPALGELPGVPPRTVRRLGALLERALSPDPAHRPASPTEFARALRALLWSPR